MKILAIAPYEGLKEIFKKVGEEYQCDFDVEHEDFCKGKELSRKVMHNQADIIISRGGTASYVERELSVPVIEVEVSGYDILRILTFIKDYEGKKGLIAFSKIANGAKTICDILDIDISIYAVNSEEEVQQRLEQMKRENYEVVVGDVIAVQKAESIGLNGFLLTSGEESVKKAFDQARKLFNHLEEVKSSYKPIELYVEHSNEAVAILSKDNHILYSNQRFVQLQQANNWPEEVVLMAVERMERTGSNKSFVEHSGHYLDIELEKLDQELVAITCRESDLQHVNQHESVNIVDPNWQLSRTMKTFITTGNDQLKRVIEQAQSYHQDVRNIWITGAVGTGKESLAHFIHFSESSEVTTPLAVLHCERVAQNIPLEQLTLDSDYSVLLLNIERLTHAMQQQLLDHINTQPKDVRYLVTCNIDMEEAVRNQEFLAELFERLSTVKVDIPLLAERKEDIEVLALSFIHEFNLELGKQVVGLRSEALELLKEQSWEGNVNQLKAVIKECVAVTNTPYIERESLEQALKNENGSSSPYSIDLSGTLEDIEGRIIYKIWNEEGQNRTKTAKRLGINRTTLWRRLNKVNPS
ncbi:sigma-54-dependent Fis family transcriptional regulator [Alkalicoccobacillus porphyridii]|uniref:sigma-54-dependent Fis family transcriptional regulator n=1 Tax=Alkalicoccobacillus porphyridii TaxID=2597270 RepID=UPI00163D9DFF|nr:sigma-54-dependent transcriptional regulator [Alkalicoccobacillus porphyridii]